MDPVTTKENNPELQSDTGDEYQSQNAQQIEAARLANNTWSFNDREYEKYVARGEAIIETSVLDRATKEPSGTLLIHIFRWDKEAPFVSRAAAMVTKLKRVGRSNDQEVDTSHLVSVNADLYKAIIVGGELKTPKGNSEFDTRELSREEMIKHANLYPESASEAIETWLSSATIEILSEDGDSTFDYLFSADETIKAVWRLGDRDAPVAAGILVFKAPPSEARREYDQAVSKLKTRKQGELNIAELQENFGKKIQYGARHLINVEGIAVESEGKDFDNTAVGKSKFITLFNPIWFAEAVDVMQESFDITAGKSKTN